MIKNDYKKSMLNKNLPALKTVKKSNIFLVDNKAIIVPGVLTLKLRKGGGAGISIRFSRNDLLYI